LQYLKGKLSQNEVPPSALQASFPVRGQERAGMKPLITLKNAVKGRKYGQLLVKTGYVTYFNYQTNNPDWVAWELTSAEAYGRLDRSGFEFVADNALPRANRVAFYDYKGTRYDRGHMCPAGDMKWSAAAMHDCFYMSNVCPQDHELNQGSWEHLESACRRWASKMGSIYIVCGPIYNSKTPEYIGIDHRVAVPDAFFKVIVSLKKGNEKGIAFYYENTDRNQSLTTAVRSIDQIEKMTKFDFFSELPNNIENRIEAETKLW
jgi:endonuclease G